MTVAGAAAATSGDLLDRCVADERRALAAAVAKQYAGRNARIEAGRRRWRMLNRFADVHAAALSVAAQAVYLQLFRHADRAGVAKLSIARLAKLIGMGDRTARGAVRELRVAGIVRVKSRGTIGRGGSVYVLVHHDAPVASVD